MAITHAVLGGTPALCSGDLCGSSQLGNRTPFGPGPRGSRPSVRWSSTAHGDAELFQICTMGTNLEDLRRASTSCIGKSLERFFSAYMVFLNRVTDVSPVKNTSRCSNVRQQSKGGMRKFFRRQRPFLGIQGPTVAWQDDRNSFPGGHQRIRSCVSLGGSGAIAIEGTGATHGR